MFRAIERASWRTGAPGRRNSFALLFSGSETSKTCCSEIGSTASMSRTTVNEADGATPTRWATLKSPAQRRTAFGSSFRSRRRKAVNALSQTPMRYCRRRSPSPELGTYAVTTVTPGKHTVIARPCNATREARTVLLWHREQDLCPHRSFEFSPFFFPRP